MHTHALTHIQQGVTLSSNPGNLTAVVFPSVVCQPLLLRGQNGFYRNVNTSLCLSAITTHTLPQLPVLNMSLWFASVYSTTLPPQPQEPQAHEISHASSTPLFQCVVQI